MNTIRLNNDVLVLNNTLTHKGRDGMQYNKHRFGRWQTHAKYAGGRPDPNAKPLGNKSKDPTKTVEKFTKKSLEVYGGVEKPLSNKARTMSLEYLERMANRDEWTTVNRARDHERLIRHSKRLFNEEHRDAMRQLHEAYGVLETEFEAAVAQKGLEMSGMQEFKQWVTKNPFEKVSRLYTRMAQIEAKQDALRIEMVNSIIKELPSFEGLSARYFELSQSQADLMTFIGIAAFRV